MYLRYVSSLEFLTYVAFFAIFVGCVSYIVPGRKPPLRTEPFSDDQLRAHEPKVAKYFVTGGLFLVLGSVHMVVKNVPSVAEALARMGYAGHLVRDLSSTHVMIVGGGTLLATGLCWLVLPHIVGRPLASEGLAQLAFWFTALGLGVFYLSLVANGIAIGRLVEHGWEYQAAKAHMGKLYKVPTGVGAGIMGLGYWCFAANVCLTIFQARLVKVPKPQWHLWRFFATGALALTVGTVQGVIQVQPANADWLYRAGHAGEWIDPISHAHINLVTGLTMLVAGALFALAPAPPPRRLVNLTFGCLLVGSLAFYASALYLGLHEGRLVHRGLTPEQAEAATPLHAFLIMGAGIAMFAAFWLLLAVIVRTARQLPSFVRPFVLAGCTALAVGTLQGPIQAFPSVNELLDRGGEAGDVIVNLHAQLNMLGGLMVILVGLTLGYLRADETVRTRRPARRALLFVPAGVALYYVGGVAVSAAEAHRIIGGESFAAAVAAFEPWEALLLVPAALVLLLGFWSYARAAWMLTSAQRSASREAMRTAPARFSGKIPRRVRRRSPAALAGYELPLALMGFPGVGWLFAGFPLMASVLLMVGPATAWAGVPMLFSPYGGPLREFGWKLELVYLPATALFSSALLYRAHARRRALLDGKPPRGRPRRAASYRTRVGVAAGGLGLLLVSLPFVPAVADIGTRDVRYTYQTSLPRDVTGQFLRTATGTVKLFAWGDPQTSYPVDALRVHAADVRALIVRAAAVDNPKAYVVYDLDRGGSVPLSVVRRTARTLRLAPTRTLRAGRYALVATHEGMFGGRDFDYFRVVPTGEAATAISSNRNGTAPQVADALFPLAAALLALLFAARLASSWLRRRAGQKLLWAAGFFCFALAAASEALAFRHGWSSTLFRVYYTAGGVLTVAYLGAGSAWLVLPRRARDVMVGGLAVATAAAVAAVMLAPVHAETLAAVVSGRPPSNHALGGHAFLWAIVLNSLGTLALVGGSLYSIARRQRIRANAWIASGALCVAAATGLSRAGDTSLVYVGELVGIALMFCGFSLPAPKPVRKAASSGSATPVVAR
ncbi:MAG: cbb3-type cytochrome c oxidase subunit I [Actinobacteria bacterium]|nr:MAG: cbb3-type cytochrome c oxidase subunit I [Actinomycetota bacterium]